MRVWAVALLINLALAIGVGWGYLWWGREARRMAGELAVARAAAGAGEREYRVEGVVRAVMPEINVIVISHAEIPGYMPAMTMGFRTAAPKVLATVRIGDAVRFTLRGTPPNLAIVAIDRTAP